MERAGVYLLNHRRRRRRRNRQQPYPVHAQQPQNPAPQQPGPMPAVPVPPAAPFAVAQTGGANFWNYKNIHNNNDIKKRKQTKILLDFITKFQKCAQFVSVDLELLLLTFAATRFVGTAFFNWILPSVHSVARHILIQYL